MRLIEARLELACSSAYAIPDNSFVEERNIFFLFRSVEMAAVNETRPQISQEHNFFFFEIQRTARFLHQVVKDHFPVSFCAFPGHPPPWPRRVHCGLPRGGITAVGFQ